MLYRNALRYTRIPRTPRNHQPCIWHASGVYPYLNSQIRMGNHAQCASRVHMQHRAPVVHNMGTICCE
jgi:hypothetical protein